MLEALHKAQGGGSGGRHEGAQAWGGWGDKLKSSAVADVSVFSAKMGLCTVATAEIRAASVRSITRGGEAAAQPLEVKSCALVPERSWLSLGMRTVHQATQESFWALAWGRRGGTNVHVGWWPGCLTGDAEQDCVVSLGTHHGSS